MTPSQRFRLVDQYALSLSEGQVEDLIPILALAETDAELSDLIAAVSRGDAEDEGLALAPDDHDRIVARLAKLASGAASGRPRPPASGRAGAPVGNRPFLYFLREETGRTMEQAAADLGGTANFFDDVNMYFRDHPDPRVDALRRITIAKTRAVFAISEDMAQASFENNPSDDLAASAKGVLDRTHPTFEEILEDSGMTAEQQRWWSEQAERAVREGGVAL